MTRRLLHLVDDDAAVRTSLGGLLRTCGFDVRLHDSGAAFLEALDPGLDSCILLDLRMPGLSGLEVQAELQRRGIELPIVFLTAHGDVPTGVAAMKGGAHDFLQKPVREEVLLEALEHAFEGLQRTTSLRQAARAAQERVAELTPREREVMELVVGGMRSREIAARFGIGLQTVKVHRMRAMAKLGVESLPELSRLWGLARRGRPS